MAITRLGTAQGTAAPSAGNSYVWSLDVSGLSLASGDVVVLELSVGTNNVDLPDFTLSGNSSGSLGNPDTNQYANDTHDCNLLVWAKKLTGADTTLTVTASSTYNGLTGALVCKAYRGVDSVIHDATLQANSSSSANRVNPGAITTVTDNSMVVVCYAHARNANNNFTTPTDVDNFVQRTDGSAAPYSMAGMGDKLITPAGTFDPAQISGGTVATADSSSWATIALRPAPPPTGVTMTADTVAFTLTGTATGLLAGRRIAADTTAFALTGTAAGLARGFKMTADTVSFALNGAAAGLLAARTMVADAGAFVLTGAAATLARSFAMVADAAAFALSGGAAGLLAGRKIVADAALFALTGIDAGLAAARKIVADSVAFTLTGASAEVLAGRKITADPVAFVLTGTDATLSAITGYRLTADSASFALAGTDAGFLRGYAMPADPGAFTLTLSDAIVRRPWEPVREGGASWTVTVRAASNWADGASADPGWTEITTTGMFDGDPFDPSLFDGPPEFSGLIQPDPNWTKQP